MQPDFQDVESVDRLVRTQERQIAHPRPYPLTRSEGSPLLSPLHAQCSDVVDRLRLTKDLGAASVEVNSDSSFKDINFLTEKFEAPQLVAGNADGSILSSLFMDFVGSWHSNTRNHYVDEKQ